jgi:hypothetical protein
MMERSNLLGCMQSFFRGRHGERPKYQKSKRKHTDFVSRYKESAHMVRYYIRKIKYIDLCVIPAIREANSLEVR